MKKFILLSFIVAFSSCNNTTERKEEANTIINQYSKLKNLNWLIGSWQNKTEEGVSTESWKNVNDSTLNGTGYLIASNGKDTLFSEMLRIEQHSHDLYYIPTVKDQNNAKPVNFKLTSSSENQLIFENPTHDFPQKIKYKKISNDSIVAEISGNQNGKLNAIQFPMSRIK